MTVTKSGYSQRWRATGTTVSYGIVLTNASAERDARDVTVLVNFVDATDTVLGTKESDIDGIVAGAPFYLGGAATLPSTEVTRLEITVRVGSRSPRAIHEPPLADLRIIPARDPSYVGAVIGQVLNDKTSTLLRSADFSAVFFDVSGNVLGGSSGRLREALPHGIREFFEASSGADSMPMPRAASVLVSVEPNYMITG